MEPFATPPEPVPTPRPASLPKSDDASFWGDASSEQIPVDPATGHPVARLAGSHRLVPRGPYLVCISCPFEHTVSQVGLDAYQYLQSNK